MEARAGPYQSATRNMLGAALPNVRDGSWYRRAWPPLVISLGLFQIQIPLQTVSPWLWIPVVLTSQYAAGVFVVRFLEASFKRAFLRPWGAIVAATACLLLFVAVMRGR